jgi:hypothetical protein
MTFSPQAKCTDWATAAPGEAIANFCGQRVLRGQHIGSVWSIISIFYAETAIISSEYLLNFPHKGWVDPFQSQYLSENVVQPGIETEISGSVAIKTATRPQRRYRLRKSQLMECIKVEYGYRRRAVLKLSGNLLDTCKICGFHGRDFEQCRLLG